MNKLLTIIIIILGVFNSNLFSQETSFKEKRFLIEKSYTVAPKDKTDIWDFGLINLNPPFEGNKSYRYFLQKQKLELEKKYPRKNYNTSKSGAEILANYDSDTLKVEASFQGNRYNQSVPNDNTLAISNDGILVSAINTNIIFYDTKNDTLLKTISLNVFSDTLSEVSKHQYDPKLIYDYQEDKFIIVYLAGASSSDRSDILVGFSQSNNPLDNWNFYALPGDAVNDTSWTDYPAISLSNGELFITANLLQYGGSWQTSFRQSIIWQVDKFKGFRGEALDVNLYHDIKYNGENLRNIHPVRGGNKFYGPEMYFLSNRNFAEQSDSIFLLKTDNELNNNPSLNVKLLKSDVYYGFQPDARMPNGKVLATNDARVLGAYYQNEHIQFVSNTVDTTTGNAAIFHGFINRPEVARNVIGNIISDTLLEYGYPNISYVGTNDLSKHAIISFDYTSNLTFPGFAALFVEDEKEYSPMQILKEGETSLSVLMGNTQRWGDYSGTQPIYNEEGKVWVSGLYGKKLNNFKVYGTWINKLSKSESDKPILPEDKNIDVNIFPNPTPNQYVNMEFLLKEETLIQVEVYDINGRLMGEVYNGYARAGRNKISFSTASLSNGMYIIKISSESGLISSDKVNIVN